MQWVCLLGIYIANKIYIYTFVCKIQFDYLILYSFVHSIFTTYLKK